MKAKYTKQQLRRAVNYGLDHFADKHNFNVPRWLRKHTFWAFMKDLEGHELIKKAIKEYNDNNKN